MDVPLYEAYFELPLLPGTVDTMPDPGAPMSTLVAP
jgi:hypothetical protein